MKEDEEEEEEDRVRRVGRAAEPGVSDGWMDGLKRRRKVTDSPSEVEFQHF